jgi:hypothetical protein
MGRCEFLTNLRFWARINDQKPFLEYLPVLLSTSSSFKATFSLQQDTHSFPAIP